MQTFSMWRTNETMSKFTSMAKDIHQKYLELTRNENELTLEQIINETKQEESTINEG
jgi:vacuolar-type H+-ATPase subunit H